jgi:hypothetical protein
MINITSNLLSEVTGSFLPSGFFESVMSNSTEIMDNVSSFIPTLSSSKQITEFSDYSSSVASGMRNMSVPGAHVDYEDNSTDNCTNEYCVSDDDYLSMIENHVFPTAYEWVLIAFHSLVFLVGLVGNALVCVAVYRNHSMRTVTNYFIVNLAVADFMVIFFCLPPTVVWDVTETWFMGTALCKIVLYFQVSTYCDILLFPVAVGFCCAGRAHFVLEAMDLSHSYDVPLFPVAVGFCCAGSVHFVVETINS